MRDLRITPWRIESRDREARAYRESIFSQSNGYMGVRGFRPDERGNHPAWRSTFLAGFFEYVRPGITDLVNQPDFSGLQFRLNGADSQACQITDFCQSLDMRQNLLIWDYTLIDEAGGCTKVRQERFLSMADRHLAAVRIQLTPENWQGSLQVSGGIDGSVQNLPIADDQLTENVEFVEMWGKADAKALSSGGYLETQTRIGRRKIAMAYVLAGPGARETVIGPRHITTTLTAAAEPGKSWSVEKRIAVASFRDGDPAEILEEKQKKLENITFDELLAASSAGWAGIWENADIQITGNDQWQGAIRYNILQLTQAMPYGDPHASIGARGLTHGRYKGCYFWDTEIFMLPFFRCTQPEAARSLLEYRYNTLPAALKGAKGFSAKGARYPWMASDGGSEQCESWDTGCCEIHITADVAHAIGAYWQQTGDDGFMAEQGVEILLQTARYWMDRFNYDPAEDRWHLLFVKGPDEYCGVTMDDFYTVSLARDGMILAAKAVRWMEKTHPEVWNRLAEKVNFLPDEPENWLVLASKVVLCQYPGTNVWRQDETFHLLEPLDIRSGRDGDAPMYRRISFDRLQRYQVLKQPAVLMYMAICPERFTAQEVEAAWNFYEPKTLHDSTLSFGIHALLAARLGREAEAVRYFEKALFLDLKDVMGNTATEGIHTGALGAAWQAMILGFGALSIRDGKLSVRNRLPAGITQMRYRVFFQGERYEITLSEKGKTQLFSTILPLK